jgi:hypothetical protein
MVHVVPGEVPRPKPEGPQAPRVLAAGLGPGLVKRDFFQVGFGQWTPMESSGHNTGAGE